MTLNKSEQALLAEAHRNPSQSVGVDHGLQGPSGRRRAFGVRAINAAHSLQKKGLLTLVPGSLSSSNLYSTTGWGVNGVVYSSRWRLTSEAQ